MSQPRDVVYVGRKPLRVYTNVANEIAEKNGLVRIGARGALISRAILVADRVGQISKVQVDVGKAEGNDGVTRDVPAIELTVTRAEGRSPSSNVLTRTSVMVRPQPRTEHRPVEDSIPTIVA